ncbi:MAG: carboxymuconolactone decarboxylase family protein, partial [Magnetococcales bacterium]|nr:carboxymuconolactone decarboxylase family protein [Magnetococcales bacterium]
MPLITLQSPETATGPTAEIFDQYRQMMGYVPSPMQLLGVSPPLLQSLAAQVGYFFGGHQELDGVMLAWMRYLSAQRLDCTFCIDMNAGMLLQMGATPEDLERARKDPATVPLPGKEKAMLLFALDAVRNTKGVTPEAIAILRSHGYSERAIFEGAAHAAYGLYVDTLLN